MAGFKGLALASVVFVAAAASASAADLLPPPPALEPLPPASSADFSGWYLRGDVGVGASANNPSFASSPNPLIGLDASATNNFYNSTISGSSFFDLGVGYQVNNWFRADVTAEYRTGSHFQSLEVVTDSAAPAQYADFYRGDVSSYVFLLNGYADIGTWYGITPYVGAGVGMAYNNVSGGTDNGVNTIGANASFPSGGYFANKTSAGFAWALMAGMSFNVTKNLDLDIGYRYLNYGKVSTGTSQCLAGVSGGDFSASKCSGGGYSIASSNSLSSNDFRIGLRWMLGEAPAPAPMPQMPLVRKY